MMLTGEHAEPKAAYYYDAYGMVYGEHPPQGIPQPAVPQVARPAVERGTEYLYTGKRFDPETGLADYGFRDYAASFARFTTMDPVRDGRNWFAYVEGDPINKIDLWGLAAADTPTTTRLPVDYALTNRVPERRDQDVPGSPFYVSGVRTTIQYNPESARVTIDTISYTEQVFDRDFGDGQPVREYTRVRPSEFGVGVDRVSLSVVRIDDEGQIVEDEPIILNPATVRSGTPEELEHPDEPTPRGLVNRSQSVVVLEATVNARSGGRELDLEVGINVGK
jgi:RHS repeat-associated protein